MRALTSTNSSTDSTSDKAWQGIGNTEGHRGQMSSESGFEISDRHGVPEQSQAVARACAGSMAWESARDVHRKAGRADHGEVYGLTRELVASLGPMGTLMRQLVRQVENYADTVAAAGQRVYDDTRTEDPRVLLADAAARLDTITTKVTATTLELHQFWSLIGRIGVEDIPADQRPDVDGAAGGAGVAW